MKVLYYIQDIHNNGYYDGDNDFKGFLYAKEYSDKADVLKDLVCILDDWDVALDLVIVEVYSNRVDE